MDVHSAHLRIQIKGARMSTLYYFNPQLGLFVLGEDVSLAYTGENRHASDTRFGLMDSTVPIEALLG